MKQSIIYSEKQALEIFGHQTNGAQATLSRIRYDIGSIIAWVIISSEEAKYIPFNNQKQKPKKLGDFLVEPFLGYDEDDEADKAGDVFLHKNILYEVKENGIGQYVEKLKPNILATASQAYRLARANNHFLCKDDFKIAKLSPINFGEGIDYIVWYALMEEGHFIHPMFPEDIIEIDPNAFNWEFLEPGERFKKNGKHFIIEDSLNGYFVEETLPRPSHLRIIQ